jgi:DNA-binding LacI/PurR family transcriptional regulator
VHSDFSIAGGRAAKLELLDRAPDVDGLFVANDLMAIGALQAAAERGRRVPTDVAVIGFDDIPLAATSVPPLTTVRQQMTEMGRALAPAARPGRQRRPPRTADRAHRDRPAAHRLTCPRSRSVS